MCRLKLTKIKVKKSIAMKTFFMLPLSTFFISSFFSASQSLLKSITSSIKALLYTYNSMVLTMDTKKAPNSISK